VLSADCGLIAVFFAPPARQFGMCVATSSRGAAICPPELQAAQSKLNKSDHSGLQRTNWMIWVVWMIMMMMMMVMMMMMMMGVVLK
jgi:predicted anti-sigma-YlaC factor YlaD